MAVAITIGWLGLAGTVRAETPDAVARRHFEQGYAAAQKGTFEQAISEFKLAYAASPNFSVLFNLGQAYGAAGQPVEAAQALERYLAIGGVAIDDEQRTATRELIGYYRRRVGTIQVGALPAGAQLALDGETVNSASLGAPIEAAAGRHGLSIVTPGYEPFVVGVDVVAGDVTRVDPALRTSTKVEAPAPVCAVPCARANELEVERARRAKTQKIVAVAAGGGAILAGGAALVLAVVNGSRYSDWQRKSEAFTSAYQRDPASATPQQLERLLQEETAIRNRDAAALGLGVGAGVLAVTSVALYLTAGSSAPSVSAGPRGAWSFDYRFSF